MRSDMTGTELLSLLYFAPLRGLLRKFVYSSDSGSAPVMSRRFITSLSSGLLKTRGYAIKESL